MREYFKLAWRNIWRNRRRTLIAIASVFFAIFFALVMRAMQIGSYSHWTESIIRGYSGFIQVHQKGYWDDPILENSFGYDSLLVDKIANINNVKGVIPRFESFALSSTGNQTKGVMVICIDPDKEKQLLNPESRIVQGTYLDNQSNGALISQRLADFLNVSVNDTVTLLSQGYQGTTAAGIFPVAGIIRMPNPELDRRMIFLTVQTGSVFFNAENRLTSLVINLEDPEKLEHTLRQLKNTIDSEFYEVMSWKELNPEIVNMIESDQGSGFLMLGLLYLMVGFGVLGTLIMMTAERKREFGIMVAVGMQKIKLGILVGTEMLLMGLIGILSGISGSIPVILYFRKYPIEFNEDYKEVFEIYGMEPVMPFAFQFSYFFGQSLIVLLIFVFAILYPLYSVMRLKEIKALRA